MRSPPAPGPAPNVWQSNRAGPEDAAAAPKPATGKARAASSGAGPQGRQGRAAEGRKGRAAEGGAQSPKGAGRSLSV